MSPPPVVQSPTSYRTCNHLMFFASKLFCIQSLSQRPASVSQGSARAPQALSSADMLLNWKLPVCQHFVGSLWSSPSILCSPVHLWLHRWSQHLCVPLKQGPALSCAAWRSGYHTVKPASAGSQRLDLPEFLPPTTNHYTWRLTLKECRKWRNTWLEKVTLFNSVTTDVLFQYRPVVQIRDAAILFPEPGIGVLILWLTFYS